MKPIMLSIKGLNSFSGEQVIDFEKLTGAGIFGIFGSTGSGKSSIIDAMTMALYGEMSRSDGDNRHCINTGCDSMNVRFEFEIKTSEAGAYIVERNFKKTSKDIGQSARLYRRNGNNVHVIADKIKKVTEEVINLIGLSYDDFSRSVVLPQGKFSEFLLLENKSRRNMLERIFQLERYGKFLNLKIKEDSNQVSASLKLVDNSLLFYEDVSRENLLILNKSFISSLSELNELKEKLENKNIIYSQMITLRDLFTELHNYRSDKKICMDKETEMIHKKLILSNAKKADIVKPIITAITDTESKLADTEAELKNQSTRLSELIINEENAVSEYTQALKNKDERYPLLLAEEEKLKQAVKLLLKLENIKKERIILLDEYRIYNEKRIQLNTEKDKIELEIRNGKERLVEITARKNDISVPAELRDIIKEGYNAAVRLMEIEPKITEYSEKLELTTENIRSENDALQKTTVLLTDLISTKDIAITHLNELRQNDPGGVDILIQKKEEILIKEADLKSATEKANRCRELSIMLENLQINGERTRKALETAKSVLDKLTNELCETDNKLEEALTSSDAYNLAKILTEGSECPVCGSISHPKPCTGIKQANYEELQKIRQSLLYEIESAKNNASKLEIEIGIIINDYNKTKLMLENESFKIDSLETDYLEQMLLSEKHAITAMREEYESLSHRINDFTSEKNRLDTEIQKNGEKINILQVKKATLEESLRNSCIYADETKKEMNSLLQAAKTIKLTLDNLFNRIPPAVRIDCKNISVSDDFILLSHNVKKRDVEKETLEKEEKTVNTLIDELNENLYVLNNELSACENEMNRITVIGIEKKEIIEAHERDIKEITGNNNLNPDEKLTEIKNETAKILNDAIMKKNALDNISAEKQEALSKNAGLIKRREVLADLFHGQSVQLNSSLSSNGFSSLEESLSYIITVDEQVKIENEITLYDNDLKNLNDNIIRLESKIPESLYFKESGFDINKTNIEYINSNIFKLRDEIDDTALKMEGATKSTAILKEKIEKMESDIVKAEGLEKEKKRLSNRNDLLKELLSLLEGNKFVEFIAKRQLRYITVEASRRLMEMTSNRYSLELDGTDFIIRDDYDGGARRSPRTLSGGETFIASLCLALALSSKIQLKNRAPLEFFFLDEGFGSLDSELLDVVIGSLESLRMENMTVGLISHVDELKQRIHTKLMVTPPVQGLHGSIINYE